MRPAAAAVIGCGDRVEPEWAEDMGADLGAGIGGGGWIGDTVRWDLQAIYNHRLPFTGNGALSGDRFEGLNGKAYEAGALDEKTKELLLHGFGFYHEEYEKVDGTWKFVWRQLRRTFVLTREAGNLPAQTAAR